MFAALCMNPEFFKDRLQCFFAVAPVVTLTKIESKLISDMSKEPKVIDSLKTLGPHNMYKPSTGTSTDKLSNMIIGNAIGRLMGKKVMEGVSDRDPLLMDQKALENYMKFFPSGASFRQMNHLKQLMHINAFRYYDFDDEDKNMEKYGQKTPPEFDFSNIKGYKFDITLVCG